MKERKNEDMPTEEFPTVKLPHEDAPVGDPPVPNRAFTEMRMESGIDVLTEAEKARLYFSKNTFE